MKIIGPDYLVFGVDNVDDCIQYLTDYGLKPHSRDGGGTYLEALDGTGVKIYLRSDASLPAAMETATTLRETVYGVADEASLQAIESELRKDREVVRGEDGVLRCRDDMGFALGFQITKRRALDLPAEASHAPGAPAARAVNALGASNDIAALPRSLSHVVYFVPDAVKAEAFYNRLGFVCTDRFVDTGPFLRPAGTQDHHTLFLIQTPPFMKGIEHFTFHLGGPTEVMLAGSRFVEKGYESFWGPGRHQLGSNWFWYFNSPMGCHVEYDADMDMHDEAWTARVAAPGADNSQYFLFHYQQKWFPGGPPAKH
ncbi:VOC family protein [Pseudomonas sp. WHRI 8519]|uniref:VOC family protein n=1 Tax=Pseudomonas sp. WHRI 8519 TaxID=3162567 RepID=UPI0032EC188B